MAVVVENPCIVCDTETYAYPIDSEYKPIVRVYESPYKSGDCPVIESLLNRYSPSSSITNWGSIDYDDYDAVITKTDVSVRDKTDKTLVEGKKYEIRIYQSSELVEGETSE